MCFANFVGCVSKKVDSCCEGPQGFFLKSNFPNLSGFHRFPLTSALGKNPRTGQQIIKSIKAKLPIRRFFFRKKNTLSERWSRNQKTEDWRQKSEDHMVHHQFGYFHIQVQLAPRNVGFHPLSSASDLAKMFHHFQGKKGFQTLRPTLKWRFAETIWWWSYKAVRWSEIYWKILRFESIFCKFQFFRGADRFAVKTPPTSRSKVHRWFCCFFCV